MRRLIVLTAHPELHTPCRLAEAGRALGVEVALRSPRPGTSAGEVAGAALLARAGTFSLLPILKEHRRLVAMGAAPLQTRRSFLDACDQWRTLERARAAAIAIPATALVRRPAELRDSLARVPGPPWFVKGRRGSQGTQVLLVNDADAAARAVLLFWGVGASALVQEDLRARGPIERHLVASDRVLASALAAPAPGEFRSNVHRGGRVTAIEPAASRAAELAVRVVRAIGLPIAAVDAIGGREPLLLEVNASPGLQSLERATGRDLATSLLAALGGYAPDA